MIDNVILNELANHNLEPCQLIKKRVDYKKTTINTSKLELNKNSLKNSASGQLKTLKPNQFCLNHSATRSLETNSKKNLSDRSKNSTNFVNFIHRKTNLNRKPDVKHYTGGFIPDEVKSLNPRGRKEEKLDNCQATSDREESLSYPRWHKPSLMKKKTPTSTPARELRTSRLPEN